MQLQMTSQWRRSRKISFCIGILSLYHESQATSGIDVLGLFEHFGHARFDFSLCICASASDTH
jgi:hypothetical protein